MVEVGKLWKKHPQAVAWTLATVWVLFLGWIAFLWNLGSVGLVDETEPLFAEAARQMTVTGDWITPYFNGNTRFDKPPLVYWLMAVGYQVLGVNEWAVRLPSALSAIAIVALGFYTLQRFGHVRPNGKTRSRQFWWTAALGAALMALNPETLVWGRIGVSDMLLTGCIACSLFCFFLGYASPPNPLLPSWFPFASPWYLAFYTLIGLGVLAKGPVGLVIPGLIVLAFLLYLGNLGTVWREARPLLGLVWVALLTVPWYGLVIQRNHDFIDKFFGYHNFERFTGVVNQHWAPWYFYFVVVLVGFFPWSAYLPGAIAHLRPLNRQAWQSTPRSQQLGLFALMWFGVIFGFFTIAVTKLPSYVLPLMPGAAILVTLWLSDRFWQVAPRPTDQGTQPFWRDGFVISGSVNLLLCLILGLALWLAPRLIGPDASAPDLQRLITTSGIPILGGIIWGGTTIAILALLAKPQGRRWLWLPNLIGFLLFIALVCQPLVFVLDQARQASLRDMATEIVQQQQPPEEIVMIGLEKPTIVFYSDRLVRFFRENAEAVTAIKQSQTTSPTVLVLTYDSIIRDFGWAELSPEKLRQQGGFQLMRVKKQDVDEKF